MKNALQIHCKFLLFLLATCLINSNTDAQKTKEFTGMLEYSINLMDTSLNVSNKVSSMVVYTNDTISRMENFTGQLGKQVTIRHMEMNKSYLLIEVNDTAKFAIKTDLNVSDSLKKATRYTFKKKMFKKKVLGMRANRMMVDHPDFKEPIEFLYLKKYSREYLNNFPSIPGLLVQYSISTPNGIMNYKLEKFSEYKADHDLFGIPSNFKKVTIDEFMDEMLEIRSLTNEN
jgi:hypothetical protein